VYLKSHTVVEGDSLIGGPLRDSARPIGSLLSIVASVELCVGDVHEGKSPASSFGGDTASRFAAWAA